MQIIRQFGWVYYVGETADQLDEHKCGKWMYFFGDVEFAEKNLQSSSRERCCSRIKT